MKKILLIILLSLAAFSGKAQDRLVPASSGIYSPYTSIYDVYLSELLIGQWNEFAYICTPSFTNEYALKCWIPGGPNRQNERILVLREAKFNVWYKFDFGYGFEIDRKKLPKLKEDYYNEYTLEVNQEVVEPIKNLLEAFVYDSRFMRPDENQVRKDGTTHVFMVKKAAAECWIPKEATLCSELVQIMNDLSNCVKNGDATKLPSIVERANALLLKYNNSL